MMAKLNYNTKLYEATAAEFAADTHIYPDNALLFATDTGVLKIGNGKDLYPALENVGGDPSGEAGKVNRVGDTVTGPFVWSDPNNRSKIILAKYPTGTGHNNAPTALDLTSVYLHLGGTEYANNSFRLIGFGYRHFEDGSHAPVVAGYQEINGNDGNTNGDFIVATRSATTDTAPTIRLRVTHTGDIQAETGAKFVGDGSGLTGLTEAQIPALDQSKITDLAAALAAKLTATTAQFNAKLTATRGAAVPDSAATDIAGLVADFNSLLASLRAANIIAT